jgi:hypothetical protein
VGSRKVSRRRARFAQEDDGERVGGDLKVIGAVKTPQFRIETERARAPATMEPGKSGWC